MTALNRGYIICVRYVRTSLIISRLVTRDEWPSKDTHLLPPDQFSENCTPCITNCLLYILQKVIYVFNCVCIGYTLGSQCLTPLLTSLFHCPGPVAVPCITLLHGPETGPFRVLAIGLGVPNARGGVRKGPPP